MTATSKVKVTLGKDGTITFNDPNIIKKLEEKGINNQQDLDTKAAVLGVIEDTKEGITKTQKELDQSKLVIGVIVSP